MDKDRQYAYFLWILVVVIIISQILLDVYVSIPESLNFVSILMWFFCLLAAVFAVYYTYSAIEIVMKRRKKRKKALKEIEDKKSE